MEQRSITGVALFRASLLVVLFAFYPQQQKEICIMEHLSFFELLILTALFAIVGGLWYWVLCEVFGYPKGSTKQIESSHTNSGKFPTSPHVGDTHTECDRTYKYIDEHRGIWIEDFKDDTDES